MTIETVFIDPNGDAIAEHDYHKHGFAETNPKAVKMNIEVPEQDSCEAEILYLAAMVKIIAGEIS